MQFQTHVVEAYRTNKGSHVYSLLRHLVAVSKEEEGIGIYLWVNQFPSLIQSWMAFIVTNHGFCIWWLKKTMIDYINIHHRVTFQWSWTTSQFFFVRSTLMHLRLTRLICCCKHLALFIWALCWPETQLSASKLFISMIITQPLSICCFRVSIQYLFCLSLNDRQLADMSHRCLLNIPC